MRLSEHLASQNKGRPYVVHRLDRGTSGLLLFAKSGKMKDQLQHAWDTVQKTYLAVVEGTPPAPSGRIENYLTEGKNLRVHAQRTPGEGAQKAMSVYQVLGKKGMYTLVEVTIETGRKHQIRVHMAGLGCPVIGDEDYGAKSNPARRLGLHAARLQLVHPVTKQPMDWHSPLPASLANVVCKSG